MYFKNLTPLLQVAELCLRFSPQICLGKSAVFIEIGKCHRLYSEEGFILRVRVTLRRLGFEAQIAVGSDITDAFVRAKYATDDTDQLPLVALVDWADPFEKEVVLQKNVHKMIEAFSRLGVKNLKQFKSIPLAELVSRFGSISILCMQRLRGEVAMPWPYWKPEEIIIERSEFPYFEFYGELEPLLFKLKEQFDRIFQRVWARNLRVQKMQVRIFCETNSQSPSPFRHFEFDFLTPQSTTKATLNIVKERLARDFEKTPVITPIEALETKVLTTTPGSIGQKNLLHNHEEQLEQFHALMGQLAEVHGRENIFHAALTEDRRPERSWKKIENTLALDEKKLALKINLTPIDPATKVPLRPTHLVRPEKIEITLGFVLIRQKKFKILMRSEFVERITGGWSEGIEAQSRSFERNYYQYELEGAPTISVFETPDKKFYLHGYYG
ncbi:MAG: hypothetical protein H7061_01825 [Bdellovibrionaceae bacterium]|nr:hypothetical protein [Bdellovibrio sp.]